MLSANPMRHAFIITISSTYYNIFYVYRQVSKVVKTLANALKFRTACFTSLSDQDSERKKLRLGADVLVSTPGQLLQLLDKEEVDLSELGAMVLDEADVLLMDESFPLQPIGQACSTGQQECIGGQTPTESAQPATQFLFVTATLPEVVVKQIEAEFPEVMTLKGPGLHRVAPSVNETLVDCSGPGVQARGIAQVYANKRKALVTALESSDAQRTVVFCNTIDQCRRVENALQRQDRQGRARQVLCYHSAIEAAAREANLVEFCRPKLKQPAVLVCTDRASRGMDFQSSPVRPPCCLLSSYRAALPSYSLSLFFLHYPLQAQVDHVVLFDFPQEPSEYLRRVGRTGRAGRQGRVTVLAYGKQLPAARAVMRASAKGEKIHPSDNL